MPMASLATAPPRAARRPPPYRDSRAGRPTSPRASGTRARPSDRKSTRLNCSHQIISYAVFCLNKKNPVRLFRWIHALLLLFLLRDHHHRRCPVSLAPVVQDIGDDIDTSVIYRVDTHSDDRRDV